MLLPARLPDWRGRARLLVAVAVAARLAAAPFTEDPWDLRTWRETGTRLLSGRSPYAREPLPYAYPPVWAGWCALAAAAGGADHPRAWRLLLKLPLVAADGALALALIGSGPAGVAAGSVAALAPPFFAVSSLWGQFDALPALFTVLALLALARGRPGRAGLLLGLAASWKLLYPALAVPWLMACAWRAGGRRAALKLAGGFLAVLGLALAPALLLDAGGFFQALAFHARRPPQGMNLWPWLARWRPAAARAGDWVAPLALLAANGALAWKRRGEGPPSLAEAAAGTAALTGLCLVTSKVANEQYVLWLAAPLLLAWAASGRDALGRLALVVLGIATVFIALHIGPDLTGIAPGWVSGRRFPIYAWLAWLAVVAWAAHAWAASALARFVLTCGRADRGGSGQEPGSLWTGAAGEPRVRPTAG